MHYWIMLRRGASREWWEGKLKFLGVQLGPWNEQEWCFEHCVIEPWVFYNLDPFWHQVYWGEEKEAMASNYEVMVAETTAEIAKSGQFNQLVIEVANLDQWSKGLRVGDQASEAIAAEGRARIKAAESGLDSMRLSATAPYRKFVEAVNGTFKGLLETCKATVERIDAQLRTYRGQQEIEARKRETEAAQAPIAAVSTTGAPTPPAAPPVSAPIQTDSGKTIESERWEFEVVNSLKLVKAAVSAKNTKIPFGIIKIDDAALRKCVNGEIYTETEWAKIGVRVWKEKKFATRRG